MRFLSRHVVEFSHHVGDTQCKDLLTMFWGLAKFTFLASSDPKLRHLIIYLIVDSRVCSSYVYIHEHKALP